MAAGRPIAYLTRIQHFSAAHRLHSPHLSDAENKEVYGPCNNFHGHGHNYVVEITLRGPVTEDTGMVMNISDLKKHINTAIMDTMDHKCLDKDVPYFKNVVSTTENVAIFIWNNLKQLLENPSLLYEVKIFETAKNVVFYRGEQASLWSKIRVSAVLMCKELLLVKVPPIPLKSQLHNKICAVNQWRLDDPDVFDAIDISKNIEHLFSNLTMVNTTTRRGSGSHKSNIRFIKS